MDDPPRGKRRFCDRCLDREELELDEDDESESEFDELEEDEEDEDEVDDVESLQDAKLGRWKG